MWNRNEHIRATETPQHSGAYESAARLPLKAERVEELCASRREMLRVVEKDIPLSFCEAILAKIEYERTFLLNIARSEQKRAERKKRLNKVLPSEFFIKKPLDADIV